MICVLLDQFGQLCAQFLCHGDIQLVDDQFSLNQLHARLGIDQIIILQQDAVLAHLDGSAAAVQHVTQCRDARSFRNAFQLSILDEQSAAIQHPDAAARIDPHLGQCRIDAAIAGIGDADVIRANDLIRDEGDRVRLGLLIIALSGIDRLPFALRIMR